VAFSLIVYWCFTPGTGSNEPKHRWTFLSHLKPKKKITPLVELLDTQQVCGILHVSRRTLKRMNVDGRLKPIASLSYNAPRYHPDDVRRPIEQSAPSFQQPARLANAQKAAVAAAKG
jgi:hypothetical protein